MVADATYSVLVVDDNLQQANDLAAMLLQLPQANRLDVATTDPESLLSHLDSENPGRIDILFADIVFDGRDDTGIDFVRERFPQGCGTQVVYVTGYSQYHTQVYQTDHACFLAKPFTREELEQALELALRNIEREASEPLLLRFGSELNAVDPRDIRYAESDLRIVSVHTSGKTVKAYSTLAELAEKLPATFIQCHKSFLVNSTYIRSATSNDIVLDDGTAIPISRRRRKWTHEQLMRIMRSS